MDTLLSQLKGQGSPFTSPPPTSSADKLVDTIHLLAQATLLVAQQLQDRKQPDISKLTTEALPPTPPLTPRPTPKPSSKAPSPKRMTPAPTLPWVPRAPEHYTPPLSKPPALTSTPTPKPTESPPPKPQVPSTNPTTNTTPITTPTPNTTGHTGKQRKPKTKRDTTLTPTPQPSTQPSPTPCTQTQPTTQSTSPTPSPNPLPTPSPTQAEKPATIPSTHLHFDKLETAGLDVFSIQQITDRWQGICDKAWAAYHKNRALSQPIPPTGSGVLTDDGKWHPVSRSSFDSTPPGKPADPTPAHNPDATTTIRKPFDKDAALKAAFPLPKVDLTQFTFSPRT